MQDEQGPISTKERVARFQNLINNANKISSNAPVFKPTPKSNPPPLTTMTTSTKSTPPSTASTQQQGQVESPSIMKPSAAKGIFQGNTLNTQSSQVNKMPSQQMGSSGNQSPPRPSAQVAESPVKGDQSTKVDSTSRASVNAIKMMLEGMNLNMNQPTYYSKPNRVSFPQTEEKDIQIDGGTGEKVVPTIETNTNVGNVKDSAHKLNLFFEAQKQSQKVKAEEQQSRNITPSPTPEEKPEESIPWSSTDKLEQYNNTQNITAAQTFGAPPSFTSKESSEQVPAQQEGSLMARLQKRKKQSNQRFESDSD